MKFDNKKNTDTLQSYSNIQKIKLHSFQENKDNDNTGITIFIEKNFN